MNKFKLNETGEKVAASRYYQKNEKGEIIENWTGLVNRVVKHVCSNETDEFKGKITELIGTTKFLPNSPCLVNAGRKTNKAGLMACYVSKAPEDTWESMCETIKNFGDVARAGGGCGLFLGNIRPEGSSVFGSTHAKACGPIEHMRMISEVMASITQAGFRGMACAHHDTRIPTEKGLIRIGDIAKEKLTGIKIFTQFGDALITKAWHNGEKEVFEVITERGISIKLTGDHVVYVIENYNNRNHGKLSKKINKIGKWKQVSELKPTDSLVINLDEKWFGNDILEVNGIRVDEKMAALISYMKCDGWLIKSKESLQAGLITDSDESFDFFTKNSFSGLVFDNKPIEIAPGVRKLVKQSKDFEKFHAFGEFYSKSCDIPDVIFRSPKSVISSFLKSAFDAEGTVDDGDNRCRIIIGMVSAGFIDGVQQLLNCFGIQSSILRNVIHKKKLDGYDRSPMHYLHISSKHHVKKFIDEIGFISKRKQDRAILALSKLSFSDKRGNIKCNKTIHKVKSIKSIGIGDVYDISTTNETFLGNGIVVHNCLSSLQVSHPDIVNFIKCKQKERALKTFLKEDIFHHYNKIIDNTEPQLQVVLDKFIYNFNISVLANDKFMDAVEKDLDWELSFGNKVYRKLKAKEIFDIITENAWRNGDPGFLFEDTINNNSPYRFSNQYIQSSNPCGEQILPSSNANCNLGSIDVAKFYSNDDVNWESLKDAIETSFQFLDNVIDVHSFPSESFKQWGMENRPVGLGIMGFADLLLKLKLKYGSPESIKFGSKLMKFFADVSHEKSVQLGKDKGTPKCCKYKELEYRRNVTTTSIAPTGTISLLAGCSSSIEPIFSATIFRHDNTGSYEIKHPNSESEWFACALDGDGGPKEVKYQEHVLMQAAFQKYCDSGISKTINMPSSATVEDVKNAYKMAWEHGCKGITVYRNNSKTTQVLNLTNKIASQNKDKKIERPKELNCDIFKIKADGMDWHIIVGVKDKNPYELFAVNGGKVLPEKGTIVRVKNQHYSLLDDQRNVLMDNIVEFENKIDPKVGLETRRFSLELRHGIPPKFIVEQIDKSNDIITSFSKATARIFKKYYLEQDIETGSLCPDCLRNGKESKLIYASSCVSCPSCLYSKCN